MLLVLTYVPIPTILASLLNSTLSIYVRLLRGAKLGWISGLIGALSTCAGNIRSMESDRLRGDDED